MIYPSLDWLRQILPVLLQHLVSCARLLLKYLSPRDRYLIWVTSCARVSVLMTRAVGTRAEAKPRNECSSRLAVGAAVSAARMTDTNNTGRYKYFNQ